MSLTIAYNFRHLLARKAASAMTIIGIALVVFVFVAARMLSAGLYQTLSATGSPKNVMVIRNGAQNEIQSGINREHVNIILDDPDVSRDEQNRPLGGSDVVVIVSLTKRMNDETSNVTLRGASSATSAIRLNATLSEGKFPAPGSREIIVGKAIHSKFRGTDIGDSIRLVGTDWKVVGIFDTGNSGFNSEIWGDVDVMAPAFRRERLSSVLFRMKEGANFEALKERLENNRQLTVSVKREDQFYADQSRSLSKFITIIGTFVSVIFSLGAIVGAMVTMYSTVANRIREIGILRAIGFGSSTIFRSFITECVLMALFGGVIGVILASFMTLVGIQTTNFTTFSDIAFGFALTPGIAFKGLVFALVMGLIGGALPALRAARTPLLNSLRAE